MKSVYKSIGMTGPREGLTKQQKGWLSDFLDITRVNVLHHGDCVGADNEVATEFSLRGTYIIAHPGNSPDLRARCSANDLVLPCSANLLRNGHILINSEFLLAFSKTEYEPTTRSGTWFTIRYARKINLPRLIVMPNGTEQYEPV